MLPQAGIEAILSRKHKKQQLSLELVTHHDVVIEDPLVERRQKHPRDCQNANQSLRLRQLTWPPPLDRSCEDRSMHQSSHAESENLSGRFTRVRSGERSREIPADKMMNRETEPTPATPQPARGEPTLPEVAVGDLSPRDWLAVARNAGKKMLDDNMTMIASALAYSTFFAIPSVLLAVVGLFTLLAGPGTIDTLIRHLGQVMPAQATQLLRGSLVRLDKQPSAGLTMTIVGFALAFWATTGAMTSYMTALNLAYERKDTRPFVKKRIIALAMVACIGAAFLLVAGLLIFGPPIEKYLGARDRCPVDPDVCLVGRTMADPGRRPARCVRDPAVARPRRRASTLAVPHGRQCDSCRDLAARLGRVRVLHRPLRLLQQDVGLACCRDHHAHLALVDVARAALRRRIQRRGGAKPRTQARRARRA